MEKILEALRNPTIFNGLSVFAYLWIAIKALGTDSWPLPKIAVLTFCVLAISVVTGWLNYFAWKNPRFLAYGPDEYIRESEMEHERKMTGKF